MQPEKIHCYAHSITQNIPLEQPAQGPTHEDIAMEGKNKATKQQYSGAESAQTAETKGEPKSERIRKRIQEKREKQQKLDEDAITAANDNEALNNKRHDEKKDEEYVSKPRDEL